MMRDFVTTKWKCPLCRFPENFQPVCALCGWYNERAEPEHPTDAAKSQGRRAIGIEIEERYCETATQRLS